jgi:hypothetical protein
LEPLALYFYKLHLLLISLSRYGSLLRVPTRAVRSIPVSAAPPRAPGCVSLPGQVGDRGNCEFWPSRVPTYPHSQLVARSAAIPTYPPSGAEFRERPPSGRAQRHLPALARCLPAPRPYLPTLAPVFPIAAVTYVPGQRDATLAPRPRVTGYMAGRKYVRWGGSCWVAFLCPRGLAPKLRRLHRLAIKVTASAVKCPKNPFLSGITPGHSRRLPAGHANVRRRCAATGTIQFDLQQTARTLQRGWGRRRQRA